jgi:hypothetical protein
MPENRKWHNHCWLAFLFAFFRLSFDEEISGWGFALPKTLVSAADRQWTSGHGEN